MRRSNESQRANLPGYLTAQSAKLSAGEIRARLDKAAEGFLVALDGFDDASAHRRPGANDWSVAEVVDHVSATLEEVTGIMRTLMSGLRSGRPMTTHAQPKEAARPLGELVARLRANQAAVSALLARAVDEPHTDLRVPDHDFGEINWKGYALVLRLHYKDHTQQVTRTSAVVVARVVAG